MACFCMKKVSLSEENERAGLGTGPQLILGSIFVGLGTSEGEHFDSLSVGAPRVTLHSMQLFVL